jgi:hypothetical protein
MAARGGVTGFPFNVILAKDERTQTSILHKKRGRLNARVCYESALKHLPGRGVTPRAMKKARRA